MSILTTLSIVSTLSIFGYAITCVAPGGKNDQRSWYLLAVILNCINTINLLLTPSTRFTANGSYNTFLTMIFGAVLFLDAIDMLLLTRNYPYPAKDQPATIWRKTTWTINLLVNKRRIGTAQQVKNVPRFSSRRPTYRPSKIQFLFFRSGRCILSYLLVDLITSLPRAPDAAVRYGDDKIPFVRSLIAGSMSGEAIAERLATTIAFWSLTYLSQSIFYDLLSVLLVGLGINDLSYWPPRFGPIAQAYSVRRFWGVFWHQDMRYTLTSISNYLTNDNLGLEPHTRLSRYTKLFLAFSLSGLAHTAQDLSFGVPLYHFSSMRFFTMQAVGILAEDMVKWFFDYVGGSPGRESGEGAHKARRRRKAVGYAWVLVWLVWSTPVWSYPIIRLDDASPLPVHFFEGRKRP